MDTLQLTQFSLANAFDTLAQVCCDLTQEQADWQPPGIANPIGALYWHTISGVDEVVYRWALQQEPLHQRSGWKEKVLAVTVPEPTGEEGWLEWMRAIRVSLPALHEYAKALAEDLQTWLATLTPEALDRMLKTPIGEYSIVQMLEVFVIWHIDVHCGEISALKGIQGAKGYPF